MQTMQKDRTKQLKPPRPPEPQRQQRQAQIRAVGFVLDTSLGFLVNKAALRMRQALDTELAPYGVTAPQWSVLARIAEQEGLTQVALGESSLFNRATMTGILARLEARGLVSRCAHPDDPRAKAVFMTPAGWTLFARLPALAERVNSQATRGLSRGDTECLSRLLEVLSANFGLPGSPGADFTPGTPRRSCRGG